MKKEASTDLKLLRDYSSLPLSQHFSISPPTVLMRLKLLTYSQPVLSVRWCHSGSILLPLMEIEMSLVEHFQVSVFPVDFFVVVDQHTETFSKNNKPRW